MAASGPADGAPPPESGGLVSVPPGGAPAAEVFRLRAADGVDLRAALWHAPAPRAHVLFFTGRTETLEKVALPAAAFLARGISVASLDWRGQGLSDRLTAREKMGHVAHFRDYQRDAAALLADPRVAALPGPRLLLGHSMGGTIALRTLAGGEAGDEAADPGPLAGAILSAPMLGIALAPPARLLAGALTRLGKLSGRTEHWLPLGDPEKPYALGPFEGNVLTGDPAIHAWMGEVLRAEPRLGLGWPSIGWLAAATAEMALAQRRAAPPVPLLMLMGTAERVVDQRRIRRAAHRWGAALAEIPDGRHEVLIDTPEVRAGAWAAIDAFLARVLPP